MNPPLRSEADRQALIEGLRDGNIECIATDHAPHPARKRRSPTSRPAMGVTGLETAFAALNTELVMPGRSDLALLVERMVGGAALLGPSDPPAPRAGAGEPRARRPRRAEWTGRRGRLRDAARRTPGAAGRTLTGPRPHHPRRRPGRLSPAQLQPRAWRMSRGGVLGEKRLRAARGRHPLRRHLRRRAMATRRARSSSPPA